MDCRADALWTGPLACVDGRVQSGLLRALDRLDEAFHGEVDLVAHQVDSANKGSEVCDGEVGNLVSHAEGFLARNGQNQTGSRAGLFLSLLCGFDDPFDDVRQREFLSVRHRLRVEAQFEIVDVVVGSVGDGFTDDALDDFPGRVETVQELEFSQEVEVILGIIGDLDERAQLLNVITG